MGYVRVSTDDQHLGPQAQREDLQSWSISNKVRMVAIFDDLGVSGAAPIDRRPGLLAALDALREHQAGILIATCEDRFARDTLQALLLEDRVKEAGAILVTVQGGAADTPDKRFMRTVKSGIAELERDHIRARIRRTMKKKRDNGGRVGSIPYGLQLAEDGDTLVPHPSEQKVIRRILELHSDGLSQRKIVAALEATGTRPRGAKWHKTTIARIIAGHEGPPPCPNT